MRWQPGTCRCSIRYCAGDRWALLRVPVLLESSMREMANQPGQVNALLGRQLFCTATKVGCHTHAYEKLATVSRSSAALVTVVDSCGFADGSDGPGCFFMGSCSKAVLHGVYR